MKQLIMRWIFILGTFAACLSAVNARPGSVDLTLDSSLGSTPTTVSCGGGYDQALDTSANDCVDTGGNSACAPS